METSQSLKRDSSSGPAPPPEAVSQRADSAGAEDVGRHAAVVETEPNPEYVTGVKLVILIATVGFASFLMMLDLMIVSTVGCVFAFRAYHKPTDCVTQAIPKITDQFHSLADVGWYASAYQVGSLRRPSCFELCLILPLQWTFLVFFAIFEVGSVICGAASSSSVFIGGRFIAGFGAAGVATGTITMVSNSAPLEKRAGFYINLPVGALAALSIFLLRIPEPTIKPKALSLLPRLHHHLDLVGFILFAPAIVQLLLAFQFGGRNYPWNSSQVIGLFVGAAATFAVWALWNRHRRENAMIPRALIRQRNVLASAVYNACQTSALYASIYYLPIWFQAVKGASPVLSGPLIAVQAAMDGEELASGIAFMVFSQAIGPAIANTIYNVIFLSTLPTQLAEFAPNADAQAIINAGASGFRSIVSPANLD
ncbi:hypothetical protein SLS62_011326, partial [Diatrype stigma]